MLYAIALFIIIKNSAIKQPDSEQPNAITVFHRNIKRILNDYAILTLTGN